MGEKHKIWKYLKPLAFKKETSTGTTSSIKWTLNPKNKEVIWEVG